MAGPGLLCLRARPASRLSGDAPEISFQQSVVARPVERGARIGFASRRDVGMSRYAGDRVARLKRARERGETRVLRGGKRPLAGALELDADGKIVAACPALPARLPGVPRAFLAGN